MRFAAQLGVLESDGQPRLLGREERFAQPLVIGSVTEQTAGDRPISTVTDRKSVV